MGTIIGVPLVYAATRLFSNENGIWTWIKEVIAYSYLEFNYSSVRRLHNYDPWFDCNNLESVGYIIPDSERLLEFPRKLDHYEDEDSVFFCGFNKSQEKLVTKISRNKEGLAAVWLYLKLKDGRTFTYPSRKLCNVPIRAGNDVFCAGGLRIQCLQPMRKWRISFLGSLQEDDLNVKKTVFVKFSYIWTASSFVYDTSSDISKKDFSTYLSKQSWNSCTPDITGLNVDNYVQAGSMIGTYTLDGETDCPMCLWGARKRNKENISSKEVYSETEFFAYSEQGEMLYFGILGDQNGHSKALKHGCIVQKNSTGGPSDTNMITDDQTYWKIYLTKDNFTWRANFSKESEPLEVTTASRICSRLSLVPVKINDCDGNGIVLETTWNQEEAPVSVPKHILPNIAVTNKHHSETLVVSLSDSSCRDSWLTGGKASSLADLHLLSQTNLTFAVPKGIVVTTKGYKHLLEASLLTEAVLALEKVAWKQDLVDLPGACESMSLRMDDLELPSTIKCAITEGLAKEFGDKWENVRFAVRSSATGEDSEEMSMAGQMKTILGVTGLEEVYKAVLKCWVSQFLFSPVQYKRQNGQPLNSPMAVIIQELVDADTAGVIFTCDPVSGNPRKSVITANYGIGESVVSAYAEPDTIVVIKSDDETPTIQSIQIGAKKTITTLSEKGVVEQNLTEDLSARCCLDDKSIESLIYLAETVEEAYGHSIDIEWALKEGQIYLLQARPVTTANKETDFEIIHENDTFSRCEGEWYSTANVGEVHPGASSILGYSSWIKYVDVTLAKTIGRRTKHLIPWSPYFQRLTAFIYSHVMFNVLDAQLRFYDGKHSLITITQGVSYSGSVLDDSEMLEKAEQRFKCFPKEPALPQIVHFLTDVSLASRRLTQRLNDFPIGTKFQLPENLTVEEIYNYIFNKWLSLPGPIVSHTECSMFSSFANISLLAALVGKDLKYDLRAFRDIAHVLSCCKDVDSVDIPAGLERIASEIMQSAEADAFKNMSPKDGFLWLQNTERSPGEEFRLFMKNHGHRCEKEFDVRSKSWHSDPIPLVKIIQGLVSKANLNKSPRAPLATSESAGDFQQSLSWKQRLAMRWIIPLCQKAVGLREKAKSFAISLVDSMRPMYCQLAEKMVCEGRLPDADLMYFLSLWELLELIKTRSPRLVQKAIRRRNLYPDLDKMIFPEISKGLPTPLNLQKKEEFKVGSLSMTGIPVCQGSVKGRARVVLTIEDAANIQEGDILIAYSINIAWSPYFPLLSGLATELGGLISHGAVVAREYRLPCIVGIHGATLKFNTGDFVMLDGSNGTLTRIDESCDE